MAILKPPTPPDYEKIIVEELVKIRDYSWVKNSKKRVKLERKNPIYKNPAYNNAMVETFAANAESRLLAAKENYFYELDAYKGRLEKRLQEIEVELDDKRKKAVEVRKEFATAKEFYDGFQNLVHKKFQYIYETVKQLLNSDKEEEE